MSAPKAVAKTSNVTAKLVAGAAKKGAGAVHEAQHSAGAIKGGLAGAESGDYFAYINEKNGQSAKEITKKEYQKIEAEKAEKKDAVEISSVAQAASSYSITSRDAESMGITGPFRDLYKIDAAGCVEVHKDAKGREYVVTKDGRLADVLDLRKADLDAQAAVLEESGDVYKTGRPAAQTYRQDLESAQMIRDRVDAMGDPAKEAAYNAKWDARIKELSTSTDPDKQALGRALGKLKGKIVDEQQAQIALMGQINKVNESRLAYEKEKAHFEGIEAKEKAKLASEQRRMAAKGGIVGGVTSLIGLAGTLFGDGGLLSNLGGTGSSVMTTV